VVASAAAGTFLGCRPHSKTQSQWLLWLLLLTAAGGVVEEEEEKKVASLVPLVSDHHVARRISPPADLPFSFLVSQRGVVGTAATMNTALQHFLCSPHFLTPPGARLAFLSFAAPRRLNYNPKAVAD
jgi:hypothetical protein